MFRSHDPSAPLPPRALGAIFVAFVLVWFSTLDYRKLIKPDEGRYAEIAREMAVTGDWVTPRLNGIKYFEKPPLQYWATAAAFRAFGEDEWTARLWGALTGFFGVVLAYFTGTALWGARAGLLGAAVLGSSLLWVMIGHINTLDMGLACFLQLALTGLVFANRDDQPERSRRRWMLVVWAALALAVLSKGIVALVLGGATLVGYSLVCRDFSPWRRLHAIPGLLLFLAMTAPWFVAVSVANPEFPHFFFIHEHFERFLSEGHRRTQPGWYFVPVFLVGALPWTLIGVRAAAAAWRFDSASGFRPARLMVVWMVVVFGFFSASSSKLPSYILPMMPAVAMLSGFWLARAEGRAQAVQFAFVALVAALALPLVLKGARFADNETPSAMIGDYLRWLVASLSLLFGSAIAALWLARRGRTMVAPVVLACGGLLCASGILLGHESLSRSNSAAHIAAVVRPQLPPGVPFYSVATYDQTLPFYLGRTLTLVRYRDEMGFGLDREPGRDLPTLEAFEARWRADRDAFALMPPNVHQELEPRLPMQLVARDTRRVIVRRPAASP